VKSSTPYPISLSVGKLQTILYVCEPMDLDVFNMGVRILAPNAFEKPKGQRKIIRKHYMDPMHLKSLRVNITRMSLTVFTT
jgi:hypothetical protein